MDEPRDEQKVKIEDFSNLRSSGNKTKKNYSVLIHRKVRRNHEMKGIELIRSSSFSKITES